MLEFLFIVVGIIIMIVFAIGLLMLGLWILSDIILSILSIFSKDCKKIYDEHYRIKGFPRWPFS